MASHLFVPFCALFLVLHKLCASNNLDPSGKEYWFREGNLELQKRIKYLQEVAGKSAASKLTAKNVVFLMGDGMGLSTITAARQIKAQEERGNLYLNSLIFEKFPFVSLAKVNSYDSPVADSASSATGYLGGVKGNLKTIGVTGKVAHENCAASLIEENRVQTAFDWAQKQGKATGFVTTMSVTDASPAGLFAHVASRKWEGYAPEGCMDIAAQLVKTDTGKNIRVIMGGGWRNMLPSCQPDKHHCHIRRKDSQNLISEWMRGKMKKGFNAAFATTLGTLKTIDAKATDYLLGLFAENHIEYAARKSPFLGEPSLTDMALKALEILQKDKNGYFLFVEGALIDLAHHKNQAYLALVETIEFAKAVEAVLSKVNLNDTLVIVTADHSHSMVINGYPPKEDNIAKYKTDEFKQADDDYPEIYKSFTGLSYGNGPGYSMKRIDQIEDPSFMYSAALFKKTSSHSGEDVPVYTIGAGAQLFTGVYDHTYIAHAVRYLLGSKRNKKKQNKPESSKESSGRKSI